MASSAPPARPRHRRGGKLAKLTPEQKQKRLAKQKRRGTWAVRVWARRHRQGKM